MLAPSPHAGVMAPVDHNFSEDLNHGPGPAHHMSFCIDLEHHAILFIIYYRNQHRYQQSHSWLSLLVLPNLPMAIPVPLQELQMIWETEALLCLNQLHITLIMMK